MKVFKIIIGIILFWAIVLLGGGIATLLLRFIDWVTPSLIGKLIGSVAGNLVAAGIACVILAKLTDNSRKILVINYILALVVTAALTVFIFVAGTWTWPQLVGYILVVIFFGVMIGTLATEKEKSPGADNTEG